MRSRNTLKPINLQLHETAHVNKTQVTFESCGNLQCSIQSRLVQSLTSPMDEVETTALYYITVPQIQLTSNVKS